MLDRVLSRKYEKGRIEPEIFRPGRNPFFSHRFQESGLGLGRRTVDLVGQHDVREDGTLDELETLTGLRIVLQHLRTEDVVGHQIGRKLDTAEAKVHTIRQGTDK